MLESADKLQIITREADVNSATTAEFISKLSSLASELREAAAGFILPRAEAQEALVEDDLPYRDEGAFPVSADTKVTGEESYLAKEQTV